MSEVLNMLVSKAYSIATHNKMLETHIFQFAQQYTSSTAHVETFMRQPLQNPKRYMNIITLGSEKELEDTSEKNNEGKRVRKSNLKVRLW